LTNLLALYLQFIHPLVILFLGFLGFILTDPSKINDNTEAVASGKLPARSAAGFWMLVAAVVATIAVGGILVS
jgi:hypothetical protein